MRQQNGGLVILVRQPPMLWCMLSCTLQMACVMVCIYFVYKFEILISLPDLECLLVILEKSWDRMNWIMGE